MIEIAAIDEVEKIELGQPVKFLVKRIGLSSEQLFVLVRNLGLHGEDVCLDFSEFDNPEETAEKWMAAYLASEVEVDIKTLDDVISDRLIDYLKFWKVNEDGNLDYCGQHKQFAIDNWELLDTLCSFIYSSIFFAASLTTKDSSLFSGDARTIPSKFKQNALNIFKNVQQFEVELLLKKYPQLIYPWFEDKKHIQKFIQLGMTSRYALLLYGKSTPQWKLFQALMNSVS